MNIKIILIFLILLSIIFAYEYGIFLEVYNDFIDYNSVSSAILNSCFFIVLCSLTISTIFYLLIERGLKK